LISASQVNGKLYRVYRHPLEKNSAVFAAMFAVPQDRSTHEVEGLSDEHPIHLDGIPVEEFEALLHALYPMYASHILFQRSSLNASLAISTHMLTCFHTCGSPLLPPPPAGRSRRSEI
jgi:hypothetical protein